MIHAAVLEKNL